MISQKKKKTAKTYFSLLSEEICSPQSCLFCQQLPQLLRKQESYKISAILIGSVVKINFNVILHSFVDVIGTLYVALNQRLHAVFIWSVDMCFIFVN